MARANARVTTGTGDSGYTGLLGKQRVPKYDLRIEALGTLDEASSALGIARAACKKPDVKVIVADMQKGLYNVMAELATPAENYDKVPFKIVTEDVQRIESLSDELKLITAISNSFILPGETLGGAALDLARTVVRRAERHVARLLHKRTIANHEVLRLLNRMSDLIFILARYEESPTQSSAQSPATAN